MENATVQWLLEGDVSLQYLVHRDLIPSETKQLESLQKRLPAEGFAGLLLGRQNEDGHWGRGFYQPKWISTHYTLLELKTLGMPRMDRISRIIQKLIDNEKGRDGGMNPSLTVNASDLCINGMFLNYACYFGAEEEGLKSVVDFIIEQQMSDGGFNCRKNRSGAKHSSVHTTISALEGILSYKVYGYKYRLDEMVSMAADSEAFLLRHRLYKSDVTGEIIHPNFTKFSFPCRWYYDVLRAMEYMVDAQVPYDERMSDALELIRSKCGTNGHWKVQNKHPGQVHHMMEQIGKESRMNTYRALKVLNCYSNIKE